MAEKIINYEDNIFFIHLHIRFLKDSLKLDLNTSFFTQKIVQDIFFYASVLDDMLKKLIQNTHLLKREEHLKNIQRVKITFNELIDDILAKRFPITQSFDSYVMKLRELYLDFKKDIVELTNIFSDSGKEEYEKETIVSEEEYKSLLAEDDTLS